MTVETAPFINGLNSASPGPSDLKSEGDDQIRLLKSSILATFPNITGAVTPTQTAINQLFSAIAVDTQSHVSIAPTVDSGVGVSVTRPMGGNASLETVIPGYASLGMGVNNTSAGNVWGATASSAYLMAAQSVRLSIGTGAAEKIGITSSGVAIAVATTAPSFNGYLTTGNISQFTNDSGFITSAGSVAALHVTGASQLDGSLGIGTGSTIQATLHVRNDSGDGPMLLLENRVINGSTHRYGSIVFSPYRDVADPVYGASIWAEGGSAAGYTADICFGGSANLTATTFPSVGMRLNAAGGLTVVGTVTAPSFVGNLTGTASSATNATNATTANTATNANTATTALSVSGASSNGYGNRTVSSSAPSGGVDGDIWFQTMTGIFVHVSGSWLRVL